MNQIRLNENQIECFKGEFLHPSLDVKNSVAILGFRFIAKDLKEKIIFVTATDESITINQDNHFELNDKRYFIEAKGRLLARIEERWDLESLMAFVGDYNNLVRKIPISPKDIFEEIKRLSKKYIELEKDDDYSLITSWIIGTYLFPIFSAYPFLHIKAPKQSGKSQCLNFLKQICFNAVKAKPSLPALSDTVDSLRGTYLIDQADILKRNGNEELVEILTDSYKKEGGKRRIRLSEKRSSWKTVEQETYGPKAFASVGELTEDLADRCLTIPIIKSSRNFPEPSEESENWKEIRGNLYKLFLTQFSLLKSSYDVFKIHYRQSAEIIGRDLELWLPMETILKWNVEDNGLEQLRKRFKQLYGYTEYEPSELEKEAIKSVLESLGEKDSVLLKPQDIREKIGQDSWEDKGLSSHQKDIKIGYIIKKFNLSSEKKTTNKGVAYMFEKEKVERLSSLYCKVAENTSQSSLSTETLGAANKSPEKISEEYRALNASP